MMFVHLNIYYVNLMRMATATAQKKLEKSAQTKGVGFSQGLESINSLNGLFEDQVLNIEVERDAKTGSFIITSANGEFVVAAMVGA